jgi:hypothetical protein
LNKDSDKPAKAKAAEHTEDSDEETDASSFKKTKLAHRVKFDLQKKQSKEIDNQDDNPEDMRNRMYYLEAAIERIKRKAKVNMVSAKNRMTTSGGYPSHSRLNRKLLRSRTVTRVPHDGAFIFDSGCEETAFPSTQVLDRVDAVYSPGECPIIMEQADGAELNITAKGGLNTGTILFKSLYTVDDISTGLLSIQEVRNNDKWFIVPPRSLSKKYGAIVADMDGTILCLGDSKFRSNVEYVYRHDEKIKLPDVSALEGAKKTKSIYKTSSTPDYEHQSDVSVINVFSNIPPAVDYVSSE